MIYSAHYTELNGGKHMTFTLRMAISGGGASLLVALSACGGSGAASTVTVTSVSTVTAPGPTIAVTETATPEAPTTSEDQSVDSPTPTEQPADSGGAGTVDSPLALGATATVGDWKVTVVSYKPNATQQVLEANQFNDKPGSGSSYGLIRVKATFEGTGKGNPGMDIRASFVGSDSREYSDSDCGAVTPNDMSSEPDVFKNGKVDGTFCFKGPTPVLSGKGAISISTGYSGDPLWWNAK